MCLKIPDEGMQFLNESNVESNMNESSGGSKNTTTSKRVEQVVGEDDSEWWWLMMNMSFLDVAEICANDGRFEFRL